MNIRFFSFSIKIFTLDLFMKCLKCTQIGQLLAFGGQRTDYFHKAIKSLANKTNEGTGQFLFFKTTISN